MKKNIAKAAIAVVLAGAVMTGQMAKVVPFPVGQMQQVQAAQVQRQTISAVGRRTVIKEDGSLWVWEDSYEAQLGDGITEIRYRPIKIMDDVVFVSINNSHTTAIKSDGSLWTWGVNGNGMLGDGTNEGKNTPVKIMDNVVSVSAGKSHTAAIKNDGSLWTWGSNILGQLGYDTIELTNNSPVKVMDDVVFVSTNNFHTAAIKSDGSLWTWGVNESGQLGDGTTEDKSTPVKVMDDVVSVSAGRSHTAAIKSDGSLWTWGPNEYGQLGDGTYEARYNPVKIMDNVLDVSAGMYHTAAIKKDGSLWIWGNNKVGQLGENITESKNSPIKIMDNVLDVSCGDDSTMVIKNDSTVWAWGGSYPGTTKIMDNVMLPSSTDIATSQQQPPKNEQSPQPPAEQKQQSSTSKANYIYGEEEKEVTLLTDKLKQVETVEDVKTAAEAAVASMSENDKTSVNGADKVILFTNEAISRASTVRTSSNSIIINDEMLKEAESKAIDAEQKVSQAFSSVRKIRRTSKNARIITTSDDKISIQKESINKKIDNIEVETNYAKVSFPAKAVSNISLENKGINKVAVDFGNKSTTEKVQISFPNMSADKKYMAVVDENGKAIGGKYNPITGELTAKIEKSGVYTVIDNEKNFEDIKGKSAEMQEAIKLLASKGIISGTSETKFSPDKSISRAEVAAIILRTLSKLDENADGGFKDVTNKNWFYGVAGSAKQTGIISGYEDNTFRGNVVIPKVQIVSVAARVLKNEMNYFDVSDVEKILSAYGDNTTIAKWAKNDVALATDVNMVIRRTDSLFGGNDEMTRGDAAIILKRLFDKVW